jgi:cytochrome b561
MRWKSSGDRYGAVAIMIHWLTAAAVVGLIISGLITAETTDPEAKKAILRVHAPVGALVLLLTLTRIAWWLLADRRPAARDSGSRLQQRLAGIVHLAFYPLLIVLGGSGIAMLVLSGAIPTLIGEGPLPDFSTLLPRGPHGLAAWALIGLVTLHIAAALYHQFVRRDGLLARMGLFSWPQRAGGLNASPAAPKASRQAA